MSSFNRSRDQCIMRVASFTTDPNQLPIIDVTVWSKYYCRIGPQEPLDCFQETRLLRTGIPGEQLAFQEPCWLWLLFLACPQAGSQRHVPPALPLAGSLAVHNSRFVSGMERAAREGGCSYAPREDIGTPTTLYLKHISLEMAPTSWHERHQGWGLPCSVCTKGPSCP